MVFLAKTFMGIKRVDTVKDAVKLKSVKRKRRGLIDTPARWKAIKAKYGLSKEDYEAILQEQGGVCYICQRHPLKIRPKRHLAVDHCHETGRVRGLLCYSCNHRLIGYLVKDNIELVERLLEYLKRESKYGRVPD